MIAFAPRFGFATLAMVLAVAMTFGPLLLSEQRLPHKAHAVVSISQLFVDRDSRVAPAADGEIDTLTVQAHR